MIEKISERKFFNLKTNYKFKLNQLKSNCYRQIYSINFFEFSILK